MIANNDILIVKVHHILTGVIPRTYWNVTDGKKLEEDVSTQLYISNVRAQSVH